MSVLFPNFLKNDEEFEKSQAYWTSLCTEVLKRYDQADKWEPWFVSEPGTRELFENFPICTLINLERSKGVVINQRDPLYHRDSRVAAWTETHDRQADEFWPDEYLVFNCIFEEENVRTFRELFSRWIQPDYDAIQMNGLIEQLSRNL